MGLHRHTILLAHHLQCPKAAPLAQRCSTARAERAHTVLIEYSTEAQCTYLLQEDRCDQPAACTTALHSAAQDKCRKGLENYAVERGMGSCLQPRDFAVLQARGAHSGHCQAAVGSRHPRRAVRPRKQSDVVPRGSYVESPPSFRTS